jgi:Ran GTPase-activating protein (RanGAP) involved in mRNA processing and transport
MTAEGVTAILTSLLQNQTLKFLDLGWNSDCGRSMDTMKAIRQVLLKNKTLTTFRFGKNGMDFMGFGLIYTALMWNTTLTELDLTANKIGFDGALALGYILSINQTLRTLGLCRNNIDDMGAIALGRVLMVNRGLESLDLRVNRITLTNSELQDIFSAGLLQNTTLRVVDLTENMIVEEQREQTIHGMKENREAIQREHHVMTLLINDPESLISLLPYDMCIIDDIIRMADASISQCQVKF